MPSTPADLPLDTGRLIEDCVMQALAHEDPDQFVAWFRASLPGYVSESPTDLLDDAGDHDRFATLMARAIWNAMPLLGNGLRPRPLPEPRRNDPCFCGSGVKYKRCCARVAAPPALDSDSLLPVVLEHIPPEALEREARAGRAPLEAIVTVAAGYADESRPGKAARLLEPLFNGPVRKPDERMDFALNLLCNQYDALGHHRKKRALLKAVTRSAPRSPLRSGAWQRLAAIRMDEGDPDGAWQAVETARRDDPDSPGLAILEVQLLVVEDRLDAARDRAEFWERRLYRLGFEDEQLFRFLSDAAVDPHAALATMGMAASGGAGAGLADWIDDVKHRPLPAYRAAAPGDTTAETDLNAALAERLRGMGVAASEIDDAVAMLTEQLADTQEAAAPPIDVGPAIEEPADSQWLLPPPEVAATEALWREVRPVDKPFSVHPDPLDDADPWDPDDEAEWMGFLAEHPEAFDSLDILDDLAAAARRHPQYGWEWVDNVFLEPLLTRAEAIIRHAVHDETRPRLTWRFVENRPALRALARLINLHLDRGQEAEATRIMNQLLELNPEDNHGFRTLLANQRLRHGDNEGVVALTDAWPGDLHPECVYGRVLALYRLGRLDEARNALHDAMQRLPKVARALTAKRLRKPAIDPRAVTVGGDDQAWLYRDEMRDVWQDTPGALDWLAQATKLF